MGKLLAFARPASPPNLTLLDQQVTRQARYTDAMAISSDVHRLMAAMHPARTIELKAGLPDNERAKQLLRQIATAATALEKLL